MKYLALYRKYRPVSFSEVFGQDKIVKVLKNAIKNNKISHAFLFYGPRGTGKTTTAKLIAKMVNCLNPNDGEPCNECENCKNFNNNDDIIEIDAASNNGVDEIRELRDKINLVPAKFKYKVYIIDEVHMLTTGAFNALLKTLEEPPSHVIFILATTEFYKIPLTIVSRCQKFNFTKVNINSIVEKLKYITEQEKINIEENAIYEIARLADGGMRDAINILDQVVSYKNDKINVFDVYEINGTVSYSEIYNLLFYIYNNNINEVVSFVESVDKNGKNLNKFIEELIIFLKDLLIYKITNKSSDISDKKDKMIELSKIYSNDIIYDMIEKINKLLVDIKISSYPTILIEVCLIKIINDNFSDNDNPKLEKIITDKITENLIETIELEKKEKNYEQQKNNNIMHDVRINNSLALANKAELNEIKKIWKDITEFIIDKKYSIIAGLLNDTEPIVCGGGYLLIQSKISSIVDRINDEIINAEEFIEKKLNKKYKIYIISSNEWVVEKKKYIDNINKKIKYNILDDNFSNKNVVKKVKKNSNPEITELIDVFGEDIIEYK